MIKNFRNINFDLSESNKPANPDKNGYLNILVHGMFQDRHTFDLFTEKIAKGSEKKIIDIGVITNQIGLDGKVSDILKRRKGYSEYIVVKKYIDAYCGRLYQKANEPKFIPSSEFINLTSDLKESSLDKKIAYLIKNGYELFIRFENSLTNMGIKESSEELSLAINKILPEKQKVNLIGHSLGGLISIEYAMKNHEKVNKVISISTPYENNFYAFLLGENPISNFIKKNIIHHTGTASREISGHDSYMHNFRKQWNEFGCEKVDLTAIGVSYKKMGGLLVDKNSQLACYKAEYNLLKNVKRILIEEEKLNFTHISVVHNKRILSLVKEIISEDKNIPKHTPSNESFTKLIDRFASKRAISHEDVYQKFMRYTGPKSNNTNKEFSI